jgi:PPP family 3-phenylpropionic acid transporter
VICYTCGTVTMPLLNSVAFIYEREGGTINYGLCRGLGSAAYAVGSTIIGRLWATLGTQTLPIWTIAGAALTLAAIFLMPEPPAMDAADDSDARGRKEESISVPQFFGKYRQLMPVVVALVLIFFCHTLINNYMAKAIGMFETNGVEKIQGNAMFIAAMLELPMMFGFSCVLERMGINRIMVIAAGAFTLKHLMTCLCVSVPMFYGAAALQMFSYAALYPATVYFANEHVDETDRTKGQAVFAAAFTVAGVLASLFGGLLFTLIPVRAVLALGTALTIVGTALMIVSLRRIATAAEH